jgi:hypothetical protein
MSAAYATSRRQNSAVSGFLSEARPGRLHLLIEDAEPPVQG